MDFNGFNGWVLIVIWHHLTRNCGFQWISPREMINQEAGFNYETWSSDMWFTTYRLHHGCHELTSMWSSLQWIICPFSTAHRNWKEHTLRCEKPRKILVHWPFFIHFSFIFHPCFIHFVHHFSAKSACKKGEFSAKSPHVRPWTRALRWSPGLSGALWNQVGQPIGKWWNDRNTRPGKRLQFANWKITVFK